MFILQIKVYLWPLTASLIRTVKETSLSDHLEGTLVVTLPPPVTLTAGIEATSQQVAPVSQGMPHLIPYKPHSHSQARFPYWLNPRFHIAASHTPSSFHFITVQQQNETSSWCLWGGNPKKGETGLFALTVYAHGGLPAESLVPAVSLSHLALPQVPVPFVAQRVGNRSLTLGSHHPALNLQHCHCPPSYLH